ncbi:kynureninase [Vibrio crassostreae]|uniref:kynureninase n=1 Tax=Vibrio crassostreae TaxID=246167 RepID=UPI001C83D4F4|nr:kynureninase [Vibrio crassostreae]
MMSQSVNIKKITLEDCKSMDLADPLSSFKSKFHLPEGIVYLDGNSMGAAPKQAFPDIKNVVEEEWANGLIRSWVGADWMSSPVRSGNLLADMLGAKHGEIIVTDTICINLFKLICFALKFNERRKVIVYEACSFPADGYIAQGVSNLLDGYSCRSIPEGEEDYDAYLQDDVAVMVLNQVNYKSAYMRDMKAFTQKARERGVLIIWDLAHSAGAMPVDLNADGVDLAVGCTYKYLNGGPGSPGFVYVNKALHGKSVQPITGWFGHANQFAFEEKYTPSKTLSQFQTGTFSALSYQGLETSLNLWREVDFNLVREKSLKLTDLFIDLMMPVAKKYGLTLITPEDHSVRGSHVSYYREDNGYAIVQALIARGVIGDFRAPGVLRFGFTPLYLSYEDVWQSVEHFKAVLENKEYLQEEHKAFQAVT